MQKGVDVSFIRTLCGDGYEVGQEQKEEIINVDLLLQVGQELDGEQAIPILSRNVEHVIGI